MGLSTVVANGLVRSRTLSFSLLFSQSPAPSTFSLLDKFHSPRCLLPSAAIASSHRRHRRSLVTMASTEAANQKVTAPYGSWKSPITADVVAGGEKRLGGIAVDGHGRLVWLESRPTEGGRGVLVREPEKAGENAIDITPKDFAVRTLAQQYGGGAFAISGSTLIFSNYKDQRLYQQSIASGDSTPSPITPDYGGPVVCYADGVFDPRIPRFITVMEDLRESQLNPTTTIAAIPLSGSSVQAPKILVSGSDFYAFPRMDPKGERMAWIDWDHPNMPWDRSKLWVGYISENGDVEKRICIAGGDTSIAESPTEPKWTSEGDLFFITDRENGFWNLYKWIESKNEVVALYSMEAEFARPLWVFGMSSYEIMCSQEQKNLIACSYRSSTMENDSATLTPLLHDSSSSPSSSSSSDGLSFVLEDSDNDIIPIVEDLLDDETDNQDMAFLLKVLQAAQDLGPSSSLPRAKRRFIRRDRQEAHERLFRDYFADDSIYNEQHFRRRFRMRKHVFIRIMEALGNHSDYFQLKYDAVGNRGLTPLTKCTAALRMLAYGVSADCVDEYLKIGESTSLQCLKKFAKGVIAVFGEEYLRKPTQADVDRLLAVGNERDFPGMLGSIDCMHWEWMNCPTAWKAAFAKRVYRVPTIILEAVASYDLWIWHAFFGMPGSINDINVLDRSSVFDELYQDRAPKCEYVVNGHEYKIGYFLSDGIYPKWATFVKTIPLPQGPKAKLFAQRQEAVRKDVERAFGVLQARFAIVRGPSRFMKEKVMSWIMKACVILHNMIVEDERDLYDLAFDYETLDDTTQEPTIRRNVHPCYETYLRRTIEVRDPEMHARLHADLVEEMWNRHRRR